MIIIGIDAIDMLQLLDIEIDNFMKSKNIEVWLINIKLLVFSIILI